MEIRENKWFTLGLILFGWLAGAIGILVFLISDMDPAKRWKTGSILIAFGLGACFLLPGLLRSGPAIIINSDGIEDRTIRSGLISWADITQVAIVKVVNQRQLFFILKNPEKFKGRSSLIDRRLKWAAKNLGAAGIYISFSGLKRSIDDAYKCIMENFHQFRNRS